MNCKTFNFDSGKAPGSIRTSSGTIHENGEELKVSFTGHSLASLDNNKRLTLARDSIISKNLFNMYTNSFSTLPLTEWKAAVCMNSNQFSPKLSCIAETHISRLLDFILSFFSTITNELEHNETNNA